MTSREEIDTAKARAEAATPDLVKYLAARVEAAERERDEARLRIAYLEEEHTRIRDLACEHAASAKKAERERDELRRLRVMDDAVLRIRADRIALLKEALLKAEKGLTAGCAQCAARTWSGHEVPGDEQFPWVRLMQIGRDAVHAALKELSNV